MRSLLNHLRTRLTDVPSATRRRAAIALTLLITLTAMAAMADDIDAARRGRRPPPPPRGEVAIASVSLPTVGLRTFDGWTKSVQVDSKTRIHEGPKPVDASAITAGRVARVRDRSAANGTFIAVDIDLRPECPPPPPRDGKGLLAGMLGFGGLLLALRLARLNRA